MLAAAALVAAEIAARVDDWFFEGIPFLARPSFEDLFQTRADGARTGVPGARWKNVRLNQAGLRGPDLIPLPPMGCQRWLFLGASETFGEPSVVDGDYPSAVRHQVSIGNCVEVLNGAFPGWDLPALTRWYELVLSDLNAHTVFVLPPTLLYLGKESTAADQQTPIGRDSRPPEPSPATRLVRVIDGSRLLGRIKDSTEVPAPLQRLRTRRWIDQELARHPPDWPFDAVPIDRLDDLERDLTKLIGTIRAQGARPVLITHPVRSARTVRPPDLPDLYAMRAYVPRASEAIIAAFEYQAAVRMRSIGERQSVQVIDAARTMSGRRELFIDLVHYSPQGLVTISDLILAEMKDASQVPTSAVQ
jgi:hypothetical protein